MFIWKTELYYTWKFIEFIYHVSCHEYRNILTIQSQIDGLGSSDSNIILQEWNYKLWSTSI